MLVEAVVLGRDEGLAQLARDLGQRQGLAPLGAVNRQQLAAAGVHPQRLLQLHIAQLVDFRQARGQVQVQTADQQDPGGEPGERGGEQPFEGAQGAGRTCGHGISITDFGAARGV